MKSLTKMFLCCAALGTAVIVSSCEENQGGDNPLPPIDMVGNSIFLPNAADTVITVTMELDDVWKVRNSNTWFSVYPLSGDPGTVELSVSVLEANTELREKEADFIITVGVGENETNTQYYVFQDPIPGWNLETSTASVSGEAQSYTFPIQGNLDFEAVLAEGVDWITIDGVTESDSTLLSDNTTYSAYRTYNINMQIEANDGEVRSTEIYLNSVDGTVKDTIEVSQMGELVADFSREFIRRSLILKITGNWCGWCPQLSLSAHEAIELYPNHIELVNFYTNSGALTCSSVRIFENLFGTGGGAPFASFNYYSEVGNYSSGYTTARDEFVNLAKEAVETEELKSNTVIGGVASVDGGSVNVTINIASKEAGTYNVCAFLLEDGVIGQQSDYTGLVDDPRNYEHSDILRASITDEFGDEYALSAQGNETINLSVEIPANVQNTENLHVLVFTMREGTYEGTAGRSYMDYGYVVDNVSDIPINGFALFEYED